MGCSLGCPDNRRTLQPPPLILDSALWAGRGLLLSIQSPRCMCREGCGQLPATLPLHRASAGLGVASSQEALRCAGFRSQGLGGCLTGCSLYRARSAACAPCRPSLRQPDSASGRGICPRREEGKLPGALVPQQEGSEHSLRGLLMFSNLLVP